MGKPGTASRTGLGSVRRAGKTAIRVGGSIANDFIRQDLHENTSSVTPFRLNVAMSGVRLDNPYAAFPGGNPFPYTFNSQNPTFPTQIPFQNFFPIPADLKNTKQYSWNVGFQRQITSSLFASATYVGTRLANTWTAVELNPAQYIPGNCVAGQYGLTAPGPCSNTNNVNQRRLLYLQDPVKSANLGYITQLDDGGSQRYHGLLLNMTWRRGRSVNLAGNYTWSDCYGLPVTTLTNTGANYIHQPYQNNGPVDVNLDMGPCTSNAAISALDIRHVGNVTLVHQHADVLRRCGAASGNGLDLRDGLQGEFGPAADADARLRPRVERILGRRSTANPAASESGARGCCSAEPWTGLRARALRGVGEPCCLRVARCRHLRECGRGQLARSGLLAVGPVSVPAVPDQREAAD